MNSQLEQDFTPATSETSEFKLCYVDDNWAWFTTAPLDKQWGDDWNDVPYEHNAGNPYAWREGSSEPRYELIKVAWEGPFESPCENQTNSPYSVLSINRGDVAWLRPDYWGNEEKAKPIPAGVDIETFRSLIQSAGGKVYELAEKAAR